MTLIDIVVDDIEHLIDKAQHQRGRIVSAVAGLGILIGGAMGGVGASQPIAIAVGLLALTCAALAPHLRRNGQASDELEMLHLQLDVARGERDELRAEVSVHSQALAELLRRVA